MAISVKSKFAGLLRGLLRQIDGDHAAPPSASIIPSAAAAPVTPATPASPGSSVPMTRAARADKIELPVAPVIAALPMDLRAKLLFTPPAGMTIALPMATVMNQLAFGAVKITFGELRQIAGGLFADSEGENDSRPVSLPLPEILARLNPALLARRPAQTVTVAEEIAGPFAGRGQGLAFTTQPLKVPAAPKPKPPPEPPLNFTPPAPRPAHLAPPPATPATLRTGDTSRFVAGSAMRPPAPPSGLNLGQGTPPVPPLAMKMAAPAAPPVPRVAPTPSPAAPARPETETIFAPLADLSEHWPEGLKNEIMRSSLAGASVPLAGAALLPGLQRGRVMMTWKQLRLLARPDSPPSPDDNLELELPLKVLAPLFLAAQKTPARPRPTPVVTADIPDLFFGFPQPAAHPVAIPTPPAAPVPPKSLDTNFYVWGESGEAPQTDERSLERPAAPATDFTSRQAHPKEVVARAVTLTGVAGALVAMADGLRVAAQVPADLNADTLAAFLPQIYERLNQSARELRMGALNNVSFTVGNVPWRIFRVGSVYFAAFGHAGESLPSAQLTQLAGELDRKKQQ